MSVFKNGANIDTRPKELKIKDFEFKETVASTSPVIWIEKLQSNWRKFPIFNQDGSGSCVAQTRAKELGVLRWLKDDVYIHFSATHIYQRRANKTEAGMGGVDSGEIIKNGVTLEILVPSQNMSDAQMDGVKIEAYKTEVGKVFAVSNYLEDPVKDIETIASIIQTTGKAVMIWFFFETPEWTERPKVINPNLTVEQGNRHSVTAVDFTLINGKKCLIIEDSWGSSYGLAGQRVIDEDFFKARNWYASHLISFKFDEQTLPKPKYIFSKTLEFGQTTNDIKVLQDILKYEGLFPTNIESSGYYGAITAKGVFSWQIKHNVAPKSELEAITPNGGRVGNKTITKLNEIYN